MFVKVALLDRQRDQLYVPAPQTVYDESRPAERSVRVPLRRSRCQSNRGGRTPRARKSVSIPTSWIVETEDRAGSALSGSRARAAVSRQRSEPSVPVRTDRRRSGACTAGPGLQRRGCGHAMAFIVIERRLRYLARVSRHGRAAPRRQHHQRGRVRSAGRRSRDRR